ncbi:MAG: hypothetical protein K1X33_05580 [Methanobacteriaceae archaeon]|nr:hypothetical protein [Methanobacteriaceae archaeon]
MKFDPKINKELQKKIDKAFNEFYPFLDLTEYTFNISKDNPKQLDISSQDFDIKYLTNKDINTFEKIINAKLLCVKIINSRIVVSYLFNE